MSGVETRWQLILYTYLKGDGLDLLIEQRRAARAFLPRSDSSSFVGASFSQVFFGESYGQKFVLE